MRSSLFDGSVISAETTLFLMKSIYAGFNAAPPFSAALIARQRRHPKTC